MKEGGRERGGDEGRRERKGRGWRNEGAMGEGSKEKGRRGGQGRKGEVKMVSGVFSNNGT